MHKTGLILPLLAPWMCAQLAPAQIPPAERTIIVMSIDGLPAYALQDPKYPMPTLRRLISEGAAVERMRTTNPAFTWPCHTSMMTGVWPAKHGVLYNGLPIRDPHAKEPVRIEPHAEKSVLVQTPTLYDLIHRAGLTVAHVDWVAIEHAPTVNWEFSEWGNPAGEIETRMVAAGRISPADVRNFDRGNMTWRDQIWTEAALEIIRDYRPNLMLFHPLNLDHTHHRYGAGTEASQTAAAFEDDQLKKIVDLVESLALRERTTLIVVSDHGFKNVFRTIRPNAILRTAGIRCAYVVSEGGTAQVYITDPSQRDQVIPQVKALLAKIEGVSRVLDRTDFPAMGLPDPWQNPRMGDLVLAAKDGYAFGGATEGDAVIANAPYGSHGYLNSDPDMDAILVAWGRGIRAGARMQRAEVVDVGPTIAALLGLRMKHVDGRVLSELLR
jgi:predicted AlkP superfamily pyrophosphatase or phosphodiesterase